MLDFEIRVGVEIRGLEGLSPIHFIFFYNFKKSINRRL